MGSRPSAILGASVVAATLVQSLLLVGQTIPAPSNPKKASATWTPSISADGHVDLQGTWVNGTVTPLERPKQLEGRQFLTDAEVAELKTRADKLFKDGRSDFPAGDDFFLAALGNIEHYTRASATGDSVDAYFADREFDNRTSLIVDPPDGKIPYTPEGRKRQAEAVAKFVILSPPSRAQDLAPVHRCITFGVPTIRPTPYTSHYQIVQTPNYVVLVMEAIHDARIIPLDGRPHLPQNIRTWNGDSRGHWDGNTLVVDTTNFSAETNFMGSTEGLHLMERFTRIAEDEIRNEITLTDPATWTRPWTAVLRLKQTQDKIYEFACHEGNSRIVETILSGARIEEKLGANTAAPKVSK
jgi:hypothetical protein